MTKKDSYKGLYLKILRIGQDKVHEGISFNELKSMLINSGYDFDNDCIELAVKQWFYDSFHHVGADDNPYSNVKDLDNHLDCSFILKGESCLKLLGYETSRNSWRNGIIAITLSLIAISVAVYVNFFKNSPNFNTLQNNAPSDTLIKASEIPSEITIKIDSLTTKLLNSTIELNNSTKKLMDSINKIKKPNKRKPNSL